VRNVLVTGAAGFIGSNFVHHVLATGSAARVVALDALTYAGNAHNLDSLRGRAELRFIHGDILDRELIEKTLREESIDTIVHFAAESHVDRSIVAPDAFVRTNVLGTHSLLEAARKLWLTEKIVGTHRFHHVSTDEVYGTLSLTDPAFKETTAYAPNSPYSASKAASDHLVRAYHHTYKLDITTSNCSNNYGPYHFPEKLIPLMIVNILQGKPLPIYGDGRQIRDWLFVEDHCRAIELILQKGTVGEVYNVGGRAEWENIRLANALCRVADESFAQDAALAARFPAAPAAQGAASSSLIKFVQDRPGHDRRYAVDCTKIEGELGFTRTVTLEEGLRKTFNWFLANESWWRSVMDGSYRDWIDAHYRL
jgi:dTDP-glucose 4,6-dehydratase